MTLALVFLLGDCPILCSMDLGIVWGARGHTHTGHVPGVSQHSQRARKLFEPSMCCVPALIFKVFPFRWACGLYTILRCCGDLHNSSARIATGSPSCNGQPHHVHLSLLPCNSWGRPCAGQCGRKLPINFPNGTMQSLDRGFWSKVSPWTTLYNINLGNGQTGQEVPSK